MSKFKRVYKDKEYNFVNEQTINGVVYRLYRRTTERIVVQEKEEILVSGDNVEVVKGKDVWKNLKENNK